MKTNINFSENKNAYMPNEKMRKSFLELCEKIYEYPDYKNIDVNKSISNYFKINENNLTVTNGSLEGINLLIHTLNEKETILFTPTFWGYEDAFNRWGYAVNKTKLLDSMHYDFEQISRAAKNYKTIVLCNPNNPTLSYIPKKILLNIIYANQQCHFIVDETMLIFDEDFNLKTISKEVESFNNLSVVMSFSKFLGIAGLRTGVVFSNEQMINKVRQMTIPYSFGTIQQNLIPIALEDYEFLNNTRKLITNNRETLCEDLRKLGCFVIDGKTNFVLVKLPINIDANEITYYLYKNGLEVRNIKEAYPELNGDWLRISIQSPENNKILIKNMKKYIKK